MLRPDPASRPTIQNILERPVIKNQRPVVETKVAAYLNEQRDREAEAASEMCLREAEAAAARREAAA